MAIAAVWRFIHSERFSKEISQRVSLILTKKIGAELVFKKVEFGLFPPATRFKDVSLIKSHQEKLGADIVLEELGVYFTYASLFSSNLEIDELELKNGKLKVEIDEDKNSPDIDWKKLDLKDLYKKYAVIYNKLPVHLNVLRLTNVETQINNVFFNAENVSLSPHKKEIRVKINIKKLQIEKPLINLESLRLLATLDKKSWDIDHLNIEDHKNLIEMSGEISSPQKKLEAKVSGKYNYSVDSLLQYTKDAPQIIKDIKGDISGQFSINGNIFDPNVNLEIIAKRLKSNWINLDLAKINLQKRKNMVSVTQFEARNQNERYKVKSTEAIYDLNRNIFVNSKIPVEIIDGETNTFLYTIRDALEVFKGTVTGKVLVVWDGQNVSFEIKEKSFLKNFALKSTDFKNNILVNNGFTIEKGLISLEKNSIVGIDLNLSMPNTRLHAVGKIMKDSIDIDVKNATVDMKTFGPISGVVLEGVGPVDIKINGPMDNVRFFLDVQWKNFSVVDLHLGEIASHFELALKDLKLSIPKLEGHFNQSVYSANGNLAFGKQSQMDLKFNFKETTFKDAQKMYGLIFRNMKNFPDTDLKFETSYHVTGGFQLKDLVVDGIINGREFKIFGEEADLLKLDFSLRKEILTFEKIKIEKSRGEVHGNLTVDLSNNHMELRGDGKGIKLSDFNHYRQAGLDYDADLIFDFTGSGTSEKFPSQIKIKTTDAFIDNIIASPSSALIVFGNNEIATKLDALAGKIKADVVVGLESKQVSIKALVETEEFRELLGVLSSHNMLDKTIVGKIKAKFQTEFNYITNNLSKLIIDISSFNLRKGEVDLSIVPGKNMVSVENGIVKKWDLHFIDGEDFFDSIGKNTGPGLISLTQGFSIKASIFQLISRYVDKANGKIKGNYQVDIGQNINMKEFNLYAKNTSLKFKKMPGIITDLEFEINKENKAFVVKKIQGKYGEGEFKIAGTALFENIFPKINLDYKIERSTVPLFKRSSILLSGSGSLQGGKPPYRLNGKFQILHGEFLDDPSEYGGDKKVSLEEYNKYLPEKNKVEAQGYIDINLNVEALGAPVQVKNNMAEIYLRGAGQIAGNPLDIEVSGRVDALPTVSKFKFKGHEFIIGQGFVELKNTGKVRNSDLKFTGISKINEYEMKIDLSGKIDKLNINLSSEPALAQEDLLSLLTLGVTSDMSKNLEAGERKFVTTVGIGTLLVDQLKINEDLNSSLGLKLSVMPEFKEDVTSLVQGKSAVSDSSTSSKLKSSTKIKVNKQISKKVDVSLSSTVGGSLEQKQEVNVNYNFSKNLSLEGVYEVKPAEDTSTSTSAPNSVGADLKYRWSF